MTQNLHHSPDSHTPQVSIRRTLRIGPHEVTVTRLAPVPSSRQVTVDDEADCVAAFEDAVTAGLFPSSPPPGLARALARANTDEPHLALRRIQSGLIIDRTDSSDVAVLRTAMSPVTVLPGEQPRGGTAGGRPGQVRDPAEGTDPDATPLGLRVLMFDDTEHLRAWCADALARSLARARKRGRPEEVAATGVRRPVAASMTLVQFADGTGAQWVPMLGDGISRLVVCAAGLLGHDAGDPVVVADAVSRHLLAPLDGLTARSSSHELARRMRSNHQRVVREYERHVDDHGPDETAVRMRQFLTLPVDLHLLASDSTTGAPSSLDAAIEAVVADLHTGVDGWANEDNARHTTLRALKELRREQVIDADLFALCTNRADLTDVATLRTRAPSESTADPEPASPTPPADQDRLLLRRAVTVMAALLHPAIYPAFKNALRAASGRKRLTMHQVVDHVAPLVCEPWGTLKPITRAWAYGGPVPAWMRDTSLTPAHPVDYLTLVDIATDPDAPPAAIVAARLELALAGGTALIADSVLTTTIVGGSGSTTTTLPFRGSVDAAVDALTHTSDGLTALALAANHFKPGRSVRSARLPGIDPTRPDKVARDGVGVPVRITETVLAGYAARGVLAARDTHGEPSDAPAADAADVAHIRRAEEPTPLQNLQARARHLPAGTRSMLREIELTRELHDDTGGPSGLSEHDLDTIHDSLSQALKLAGRLT